MLRELHVHDLALVEDVWLELEPGLTALTGETGAGKTVLVGALKLLLGERADSSLVRTGEAEALVEGRFEVDGDEVLVRRRVSAEGRSRCTVDGEMATVSSLAELLGGQVDLHGQHEHQALLSPASHAGYLDRFCGEPARTAMRAYRDAFAAQQAALAALRDLERALGDRERRADYLRFQVREIDAVAPQAGEDVRLEERLPRLRHAGRLATAAAEVYQALRGEGGAADAIAEATAGFAPATGLDPAFDALREAALALNDDAETLGTRVREYAESVDHDPAALDETESRLAALGALKRKYGPALDDVLALREAAAGELDALDGGQASLDAARARLTEATVTLEAATGALLAARGAGVPRFEETMSASLRGLALPDAVLRVGRTALDPAAWTADGPEELEFLFSANTGEPPRPLTRIASGGEVSRVMLALKSALGAADRTPVLVFDEIDAGIGGATALAVGARLRELAASHQVLVVTHLAQVAAYADRQVVVYKGEDDGRTATHVRQVTGPDRVAEVARMLSGDLSPAGLAHASELLATVSAR